MKIFSGDKYIVSIHIDDHPPPHCHVRFGDGSEVCVMIPFLEPMYGATITREVRNDIEDHLDALASVWDRFHPKRVNTKRKHNRRK